MEEIQQQGQTICASGSSDGGGRKKRRMSKIERRAAKRAAKVARVSVSSSVQERGENERRSIVEVSPTSSRVSKRKKKKKKKKAKQTSNVDRIKEGEEEKGKCACQDATKRSDVLSARAVELFERENAKGTLSDRLNPKHSFFDAELKAAWKTELSKKERAEIVRRDQEKLTAELSRVSSIVHAFQTNIEDHCESPFEAYEDITPVLRLIAKKLGKSPEELRIYDPYYCAGSVTRHMKKLGFCDVYNRNEDFYKVCREKRVPRHDVVVTNPPYSDNHVKRLLRFCRSNAKPFLLLLPNYFCVKEFYHETLLIGQNSSSTTRAKFEEPSYVAPRRGRYMYWTPKGLHRRNRVQNHVSTDGYRTSPFVSFWYVDLSPLVSKRDLRAWWASPSGGQRAYAQQEKKATAPVLCDTPKGLPRSSRPSPPSSSSSS